MLPRSLGCRVLPCLVCVVSCSASDEAGSNGNGAGGTSGASNLAAGGSPAPAAGGQITTGGTSGGGVTSGGASAAGGAAGALAAGGAAAAGGQSGGGAPPASGGSPPSMGGAASSGGASAAGGAEGGGGSACPPPAPGTRGQNPLFTDQFTADPAALVHDCTFYVQCGHDEGQNGFVMRDWFLLSSTDMVHWTKRTALRLGDFAWANANAWAGQMVEKSGKFYWYVPVNQTGGGMAIGVAVGDSPEGPFHDALGKPLVDDAFEMANMGFRTPSDTVYTIDPTVFVDGDGRAYLHYGGFSRMVEARLGDDMISIDGAMREVTPRGFFEAPYLFERNGVYYELYAAGINPATIDYSTSTDPMGPWTYGGRVLDALPNVSGQDAATNHAGVAEFAGRWYIVYHLSNGPNGGGTYRREVAIDPLEFDADGKIRKVAPSSGLSF